MNDTTETELTGAGSLVELVSKAEIDQAIATAHRYPRSIKRFMDESTSMVTLNERVAGECIYALPRDGKTIEGPSARMAEIVASAWGNCRAGARIVDEGPEFITAQGVFHDLERNVAITYEVRRRITDKYGKRYKPDMIGVTGNAACSIALRNAVFKGVPKAFWSDVYEAARRVIAGDSKTLANRRADALAFLQKLGATEAMVLELLAVPGVADITPDHLVTLRGIATAIRDGDTTVEQAFNVQPPQAPPPKAPETVDKATGEIVPPSQAAPVDPHVPRATAKQLKSLRERLGAASVQEAELCAAFEVRQLEALAFDQVAEALSWIGQRAA